MYNVLLKGHWHSHTGLCDGLNVCPQSWKPNPQCDGIRKWDLWEVVWTCERGPYEWHYCPLKREARELSCPLSTTWRYNEKLAVCNMEQRSHQNSTILALSSPTSSTVKNKFLLFINYPVYRTLLQQPELWQSAISLLFTVQVTLSTWKSHVRRLNACLA